MAEEVIVQDLIENGPSHSGVDDAIQHSSIASSLFTAAEDTAAENCTVERSLCCLRCTAFRGGDWGLSR